MTETTLGKCKMGDNVILFNPFLNVFETVKIARFYLELVFIDYPNGTREYRHFGKKCRIVR